MLCFAVGSIFILSTGIPDKEVLHALGIVAWGALAIYFFVAIIHYTESLRRYTQYKIHRADSDIVTDELLQLLNSIELGETRRDTNKIYYEFGRDNTRLSIFKDRYFYVCKLLTDEFGSYDIDTSSETRIEQSWIYYIPRRTKYGVATLEYERTEKVTANEPDTPTGSSSRYHTVMEYIRYAFRQGSREKEATSIDLHHLYQNIRYAITT